MLNGSSTEQQMFVLVNFHHISPVCLFFAENISLQNFELGSVQNQI